MTPYTALSVGNAGKDFMDSLAQARASGVSEGYLKNAQRQQAVGEERYGQQELDKARSQLDQAMLSGNSDMADAALNNLKTIASRYGLSIAETRSSAALDTGVTDKFGQQKAEPSYGSGTKEDPFDADSPGFKASAGAIDNGSDDRTNEEADQRINQALVAERAAPFTGMRPPGGSLPPVAAQGSPAPIRTPGGSLPAPETAGVGEAPLRGYTLLGKDGKPMYTVAPRDVEMSQRKRVEDVFSALAEKTDDPQEKQWLSQAQAMAGKLVGTMPLDDAVKEGLQMFTGRVQGLQKLAIVQANKKGLGGPGVPSGLMGKNDDRAESVEKYADDIEGALQHAGIPKAEEMLGQAEGALRSGDPALQKDALKLILQARSGLTVTEAERRSYNQVDGALSGLQATLAQWTGAPLPEGQVRALMAIVQNMRQANGATRQSLIDHYRKVYEAQNRRKVADDVLRERSQALDPNAPPTGPGGKTPGQKLLEE